MRKAICSILFLGLLLGVSYHDTQAEEIIFNWSGGSSGENVWKCYVAPFEAATGHKVVHDSAVNFSKLKAMVKTGNVQWDMAELYGMDLYELGVKEGLFEPVDYNVVKKSDDYFDGSFLPYAVIQSYYATILGYDAAKFPEGKAPQSWKDFWDVKEFPGPRALYNGPFNNLEFALLADGVAPKDLYPLDMDRAFRSLDKIKKHVKVWWTAGAQPAQLLTDKEVVMTSAWNGRIYGIIKEGVKAGIQWNQGIIMKSPVVIPKGAPHKKVAMQMVAQLANVESQACYTNNMGYPATYKNLHKYVKKEVVPYMITSPENVSRMIWNNYKWWIENKAEADERWSAWMLK
jgi:putative spermidine/putrescine transport system substrate-binding protein